MGEPWPVVLQAVVAQHHCVWGVWQQLEAMVQLALLPAQPVGAAVGEAVVGAEVGVFVGAAVGAVVGALVGATVGATVGRFVGAKVGAPVGAAVNSHVPPFASVGKQASGG